jgi:prephenate dehydrogenase
MKIAVIGAGAMGKWLASFAKQNLGEVTLADINVAKAKKVAKEVGVKAAKTCEEAVVKAHIAIIAVPIAKTPEVVKSLAEKMRAGSLLMDVASAKSDVVDTMKELDPEIKLELVSIHPLFGPGATTLKGKDFAAVPVKPGKRYARFKNRLTRLGARVTEMEAEEHDKVMAISQCLTHFVLLSYLSALKATKEMKLAEKLRTPMFNALLELAKAVLAGNPDLYGGVQVTNKYAQLTRSVLMEACRSLDVAFAARDIKAAREIFDEALALWKQAEAQAAYKRLYMDFEGKGKA